MTIENNPTIFQNPSWGPSHLSQWKTTGLSTQQMLIQCFLNWWPLIVRPQKDFFSKYFSCDYTMHKFQGFQLNLQHIELIGKKTSHHDWDAYGELEYLKAAVITSTLLCGSINATWHVRNALPSAITTDKIFLGTTWMIICISPPKSQYNMKEKLGCL